MILASSKSSALLRCPFELAAGASLRRDRRCCERARRRCGVRSRADGRKAEPEERAAPWELLFDLRERDTEWTDGNQVRRGWRLKLLPARVVAIDSDELSQVAP